MIELPSVAVIQLLPNVYSLGQKTGLTLGKLVGVLLSVASHESGTGSTSTSGTTSSDILNGTGSSTGSTGSGTCRYMSSATTSSCISSAQQHAHEQLLLLQHWQDFPQELYTMIVTFPVWYSEWWWNLVQNDPIHVLVETILLLSILYFLFSRRGLKSYKDQQNAVDRLTKQEEEELIHQWIHHERHPLTPFSNTTAVAAPNHKPFGTYNTTTASSSTTTTATATNTLHEYRHTLVIHKTSGRWMHVEEVSHPSIGGGAGTGGNISHNSHNGHNIGTTTAQGLPEGAAKLDTASSTSTTPTTTNSKTTASMMDSGTAFSDATTAATITAALPSVNIIQVLNFATMDFLGMSAEVLPTSTDDDDVDYGGGGNNPDMESKDHENILPLTEPVTTTNAKHSKRSFHSSASNNNSSSSGSIGNNSTMTATTLKQTKGTTVPPPPPQQQWHPVKAASLEALDRYGCGSCGPRGFYGTIDVHLHLERNIATFLHTEDAILYSDGASTVTSTVAAFCKRGDIIIVDEAVYEPIRTGVQLSRANVKWFAHNDMNDLRRVLVSIQQSDKKRGRKSNAQRRFIVVEGLYKNTGSICPLDELIALKHEFNCRLILDESFSFGTLGPMGRGVTELYQQKVMHDVEITCVSLENAMGSIGGLTTGTEEVVDHQRLSGSGYAYSASSPPFTASAALAALNLLQTRPDVTLQRLNRNRLYFHEQLQLLLHEKLEDLLIVTSDVRSPIILLQVADIPETEYLDEVVFLQEVVRESFIRGVAFVATATGTSAVAGIPSGGGGIGGSTIMALPDPSTTATSSGGFVSDLPSSIRMTVSAVHTLADIDFAIQVLGESVDVVMSRFYDEETTM